MSKAKEIIEKVKNEAKFRTEPRKSPDFGKSRKEWQAAKDAKDAKDAK